MTLYIDHLWAFEVPAQGAVPPPRIQASDYTMPTALAGLPSAASVAWVAGTNTG